MATVPTGGERYFARPLVQAGIQVPHSVLDRAAAICPLRRGTAGQPGSSQARPAPPAPGVSTFNARGDGVEQAHVAGWPSRGIPGPAKVESSPAAMATDSRPAEEIPRI